MTSVLLTTELPDSAATEIVNISPADELPPNVTVADFIDPEFIARMRENRSVSKEAYYTLIVLYALLICFGALGNLLVVLAVLRKAAMKTARNLFILNLAVSDLLLCLVTMPLTLLEILSRYWPLGGDTTFLCKLFGGLTGVSEFVSSMSITAIALDRYQVIVYPTRNSLQLVEVCIILACIWTLATLLASPMFVVRELLPASLNETLPGLPKTFHYCVEEWTVRNGRAYYSIFSMICQYVVPIVTVSIAYARITKKLRFRMSSMASRTSSLRQGREQRTRRTHTLLIAISLIYAISWVPLNVCNLVIDLIMYNGSLEKLRIIFAVCHMILMTSACSNPILYGWLNDNFRKEFIELAHGALPCLFRKGRSGANAEEERSQGNLRTLLTCTQANGRSHTYQPPGEETMVTRDIPLQLL
ncbi:Neuropeptide F receptor [Amphibalanus amphitrite]|uniref:Neuropeptide F receptor n=1 Tax=Amphibalanus amphitrite TaxID=1232801 RepID=A0A6A4W7G1_AMPAM|nr:neuropeptide F receptor-like [Amphibalanus amphitrite]KAF0297988.1 Neuropeptide F receptor [Amphibalanus amphitrite]